jgi:hypothetical protein
MLKGDVFVASPPLLHVYGGSCYSFCRKGAIHD